MMAIATTGHEQSVLQGEGSIVVCSPDIIAGMPAFNNVNVVQHIFLTGVPDQRRGFSQ